MALLLDSRVSDDFDLGPEHQVIENDAGLSRRVIKYQTDVDGIVGQGLFNFAGEYSQPFAKGFENRVVSEFILERFFQHVSGKFD